MVELETRRGRRSASLTASTSPRMQVTVSPPTQIVVALAGDADAAGAAEPRALRGDVALAARDRSPISHSPRPALRLPVTGSSYSDGRPTKPRTSNAHSLPGGMRADDADRCESAASAPRSGSRREHRRRRVEQQPSQLGPLFSHCAATRRSRRRRARRARRRGRRPTRRFAHERRRGEGGAGRRERMRTRPTPHCCTTSPALFGAPPRSQPRVAAAERRMAGERQLAARREDADAVVGARGRSARAGRSSRSGWSSARSACMRASSSASAPCTTASGLPSSAVAVKTSTWVKAKRAHGATAVPRAAAATARTPLRLQVAQGGGERGDAALDRLGARR